MIDKSQGFNDVDAPPSYQHALRSASDSKVNLAPPSNGSPSASRSSSRSTLSKRQPNARTKPTTSSRWFPTSIFGLSKTAKQVRSATQGLLRDLLMQARPVEHEWVSVLGHCADTCSAHGINFSALIQEPFVEGHLPIYWAILKRPTSSSPAAPAPIKGDHASAPSSGDHDALVLAIIDASIPLSPQSIVEARLACMTVSDNALFHRLGRRYETFSPRSGTDRVLLGGSDAVDAVEVMEMRGGGGGSGAGAGAAFTVRFSITQFQLRMRVSKLARIEFIARGRLWYLAFSVAGVSNGPHMYAGRPGEWLVSLGLCDCSSPSWLDARLSIVDHPSASAPPGMDSSSISQRMALRGLPLPPKHPQYGKHRPVASLPIKTGNYQISPGGPMREVVVSLDKFLPGANLQNDASAYVDADGTLNAELEVKLQQTNVLETNCIIC